MVLKLRLGRFFILLLTCLVFLGSFADANAAKKKSSKKKTVYKVAANSAILFDDRGAQKLYAHDIHKRVYPASTTKVMTALIVLERKNLNEIITIPASATTVLPSKIYVKAGEQYRVRDLLYALLINSANDAAVALAESVAGSEQKFVDLMNKRARQLGAKSTLFANAHGLPTTEPQYTTAYDMYLIFKVALTKDFFQKAIKISRETILTLDGRKISLKTHNASLFKNWKSGVYGKTGYTKAAQSCFIGYVNKGKRKLIVGVFGCPPSTRWKDVKYIIEKYGKVDL